MDNLRKKVNTSIQKFANSKIKMTTIIAVFGFILTDILIGAITTQEGFKALENDIYVMSILSMYIIWALGFFTGATYEKGNIYEQVSPRLKKLRDLEFNSIEPSESNKLPTSELNNSILVISGSTFSGLQRAIADFPSRYPDFSTRPPKMIDDVRPWLKSSGFAENDREAHVFGVILSEHFRFSPDTQQTQ